MDVVRVLITGGAGFIGSHLADHLIDQGCRVAISDALIPQVHPSGDWPTWTNPKIEQRIRGDVRDRAALVAALDAFRPHCVVHLAAEVGVGQAEVEIERYVDANVRGTAVLLESILASNQSVPPELDAGLGGIRRLIVAGSMSAYGEGQWFCSKHGPIRPSRTPTDLLDGRWTPRCAFANDPNDPCELDPVPAPIPEWAFQMPSGVYAATKRDQEDLSLLVGQARGLSVAVARLFNCYGPRQQPSNPYTGAAVGFGARVRAGLSPRIYEDGDQLRDFVHVSDVARALWALVGSWHLSKAVRLWQTAPYQGPFNVGTGRAVPILDVAHLACEVIGGAMGDELAVQPEITGQFRTGDVRACVAELRRIREIGWEPVVAAEDGLRALFAEMAAAPSPSADLDAAHRQVSDAGLLVSIPDEPTEEVPASEAPAWS